MLSRLILTLRNTLPINIIQVQQNLLQHQLSLILSIALFVILGLAGLIVAGWLSERIEQRAGPGSATITFSAIEFDKVDPAVFDLPAAVSAGEFAAWYAVAAALLNLDETISKG